MALISISLIVCVALAGLSPYALFGLLITWIPDVLLICALADR